MNTYQRILSIITTLAIVVVFGGTAFGQDDEANDPVRFHRRNMGGPRLGVTIVPDGSELSRSLSHHDIGRQLSQFGWHFEYQVIPDGGGPQFVIQFTPMVGGVEYGKVIPGATLAMGIRFPSGFEFGLGPNITAGHGETSPTSLIVGVGKSFDYGGVSIPLTLAYATNPDGSRISFIVGYAIDRRK